MALNLLFAAPAAYWPEYAEALPRACAAAGLDVTLAPDLPPEAVDYIIFAPGGPAPAFARMTRAKAVLSLWAGVERVLPEVPPSLPLARMVDPGMTAGMAQWVLGHALRHHLGLDADIVNPDRRWRKRHVPLTTERRIGVLGLGALGGACATALGRLGFVVSGWSRRPRGLPGVTCHVGDAGLQAVLQGAEILVLLLPDTPATGNLMNADRLALLPHGAVLLNPSRGAVVDDAALLDALDSGQLAHATLDVFRTEPLPADHPFWAHPRVTVTPHIASETRAETACPVIATNICRAEAGKPLLHLVDRAHGY